MDLTEPLIYNCKYTSGNFSKVFIPTSVTAQHLMRLTTNMLISVGLCTEVVRQL